MNCFGKGPISIGKSGYTAKCILPMRFVKHIMCSKTPPRAQLWSTQSSCGIDVLVGQPLQWLSPSQTSHPTWQLPMSDGPPELACIGSQTEWPVTLLYPWWMDWPDVTFPISIWLASLALYPSLTDWPVLYYTHLWLTGQSCVVLICSWLAGLVLYPSLTDWPVLHYTHLWLTGWSCIIPIFDWLASLVLYSSAAGWPAMVCNPMLGLWTGQPCIEYESHCRLTGQLCIVSIFDWLASLALYPSLTDWPVLRCIHLQLAGQPWDVTLR